MKNMPLLVLASEHLYDGYLGDRGKWLLKRDGRSTSFTSQGKGPGNEVGGFYREEGV